MNNAGPDNEQWWYKVSGDVWDHPKLTANSRYLWLALQRYRNHETGKCYPSLQMLGEKTGMGTLKLRKALNSLVALGLVKTERRMIEGLHRGFTFTVASTETTQVIGNELAIKIDRQVCTSGLKSIQYTELDQGTKSITRSKNYTEGPSPTDKAALRQKLLNQARELAREYAIPEHIAEAEAERLLSDLNVGYPEKALPEVIRKISEDRKASSQHDW